MTLRLRDRSTCVVAPGAARTPAARPVAARDARGPADRARPSAIAVDAAVESGQPLLVVNAVESSLAPCGLVLGYDTIVPPDVEESLRAPADLAHSLGVEVERLRLRSPRPVDALLELVAERGAGSARPRAGSVADPRAQAAQGDAADRARCRLPRLAPATERIGVSALDPAEALRQGRRRTRERLERRGPRLRVEARRRAPGRR